MKQQAPVGPDLSAAVGPFYSAEHTSASRIVVLALLHGFVGNLPLVLLLYLGEHRPCSQIGDIRRS
jgi:hypothetical protein